MIRLLFALLLAAAGAAAAAATLAPSSFNSGAAVDAAPLGKRLPLVLVHGLGGSGQGWENFLQAYARHPAWRAAFKPYTFRYASNADEVLADPRLPRTISGLGAALRDALQAPQGFGDKSFVILAHSMGGLIARSMMQEHSFADGRRGGDRVLHLVTLGTPHEGTPLADLAGTLGSQLGDAFAGAYGGFIANLAWTNFDGSNIAGRLCNPWLGRLNNFAPAANAWYGDCGAYPLNPLRGYYERIVAYGARSLQSPDVPLGFGVFEPGSSPSLVLPHTWLASGLPVRYDNDGLVPYASALFESRPVAARRQAHQCDHRYLERGYVETVRTFTSSYADWAFCANSSQGVKPSGIQGGWAVQGTIMADIASLVITASQIERVLDWAQHHYAPYLLPGYARTDLGDGFHYRHYPDSQAYTGVKDGNVYYLGPASGNQLLFMGTLQQMLQLAEAAGY